MGLGVGVMINMLGGNEETVNALKVCLNKKIEKVYLDEASDKLRFEFEDKTRLAVFDDGQSCCEHRYMQTDDDLPYFSGATFLDVEIKSADTIEGDYDVHETQFLEIKTDKGVFTMANHNEHNGYYGGFWIVASMDAGGLTTAEPEVTQ